MKKIFFLLLHLFSASFLSAQLPGHNDPTFNVIDNGVFGNGTGLSGISDLVRNTLVQSDGKIIIQGDFLTYNGEAAPTFARLNTDGSLDHSFDVGFGFSTTLGNVNCMFFQPDGKIVVAGQFDFYNNIPVKKMARINTDGSLDLTFTAAAFNAGGTISTMILQPDGKFLVGGSFTSYNGVNRNNIVRLNSDGSLDASFSPTTGFNNSVSAIALQPDGKIIAGGNFTSYNGNARNRIARLHTDGAVDLSFFPNSGFNSQPSVLTVLPNGRILAAGNFTSYSGTGRTRIARILPDGTLDATFLPGIGFDDIVSQLHIYANGDVLAAGSFNSYKGIPSAGMVKIDSLANYNSSFSVGSGIVNVFKFAVQNNGKIIVGGNFTGYGGVSVKHIMRLLPNGNLDQTLGFFPGFNSRPSAIAIQPDAKIILGGAFTKYNDYNSKSLIRLLPDGEVDTTFNIGTGANSSNYITDIMLQNDGKIIIIGTFTSFNGVSRAKIARLNADGSVDLSFTTGTGFTSANNPICMALQANGKIIVGGDFSTYAGQGCNNICRLNSNGSFDNTFFIGTGFNNNILDIKVLNDDKIIAGGEFNTVDGSIRNKIVRLFANGGVDPLFEPSNGFGNSVTDLYIQPDSKIIAIGEFTTYNFVSRRGIIRLKPDAQIDSTFNPGTGFSYTPVDLSPKKVLLDSQGRIIVFGNFDTYNGASRNRIVRILPNGNIDQTFNPLPTFNNQPYSMDITDNDKIVIGGDFTKYNGVQRNRVARLYGGGCNPTHTINPTSCNSYTLNGQTYTVSGTYTQHFTNFLGCDSTLIINLNINNNSQTTINQTICSSSYTLNGQTYTNSGTYTQTQTNALGCDSIITLNLTLNGSTMTITQHACGNYVFNGQTYNASGTYTQTYTNSLGCDSIYILHLTIGNNNVGQNITTTACESYSYNSVNYNVSGTYIQTYTNASGCDSVITLNLTIKNNSSSFITTTACNSYTLNNQTYNTSGTYTQTRPNAVGCDSTITLNLTVNGNANINASGSTLTANSSGTYQWINCGNNSVISGATNQTYVVSANGSYAVVYTVGTCVDTSACYIFNSVGISEPLFSDQISVFPNPTSGKVNIDMGDIKENISIEILNILGQRMALPKVYASGIINIEIPGVSGLYVISITSNKNNAQIKIFKD